MKQKLWDKQYKTEMLSLVTGDDVNHTYMAYTDGSKIDNKTGAGITIVHNGVGKKSKSLPLGIKKYGLPS